MVERRKSNKEKTLDTLIKDVRLLVFEISERIEAAEGINKDEAFDYAQAVLELESRFAKLGGKKT